MPALPQQIEDLVGKLPGLTDRELADKLLGKSSPPQPINSTARRLEQLGQIVRRKREDGLIGNWPVDVVAKPSSATGDTGVPPENGDPLAEDRLKEILDAWLRASGWRTEIAWGKKRGTDIRAYRDHARWYIEVKGIGSRPEMRVNYFLSILGETLQRMEDPLAKYSIALPDIQQFRRLWERLPALAKERTQITALFVTGKGSVVEVNQ